VKKVSGMKERSGSRRLRKSPVAINTWYEGYGGGTARTVGVDVQGSR
jgi:hypothetical protein